MADVELTWRAIVALPAAFFLIMMFVALMNDVLEIACILGILGGIFAYPIMQYLFWTIDNIDLK